MRLRKALNRRVGERVYHRWTINDVPPAVVDEMGWEEGDELVAEPDKTRGRVIVKRPTNDRR